MDKLLCVENIEWNGVTHQLELYESTKVPTDYPVTQCQAVCFTVDEKIVLYEHIDGYYGLPGGQIEEGEDFESALTREIMEECSCRTLSNILIGYIKDTNLENDTVSYQLRYAAKVEVLDLPISDPAKKSTGRKFFAVDTVPDVLKWGERGPLLIKLAKASL